jgi:hypothetical protein
MKEVLEIHIIEKCTIKEYNVEGSKACIGITL